jgi:hypothetical protein
MQQARVGQGGPLMLTLGALLFDPERPNLTPDQLLKERGGRMTDRAGDLHNCPFCHTSMALDLFRIHLEPCLRRNYSTIDVTHRRFSGANLG